MPSSAVISHRRAAALALVLALAYSLPAAADPFLIARADTLRSGAIGTLALPDGRVVRASVIAEAIAGSGYSGATLVGIDLGARAWLYADSGSATRPLAPFLAEPAALRIRSANATDFVPIPQGGDPAALLGAFGAIGFRATCPIALACPRSERPEGVLDDGFEAP
jgi:hypothetical protein